MARMQASLLRDGRLHLNDGPIDLVIFAEGASEEVRRAFRSAIERFSSVLDELCAELPLLRAPVHAAARAPAGAVARRMDRATRPFGDIRFITPMAAVAGAVADEILSVLLQAAPLRRAYVNNGGDIALHLTEGTSLNVGVVDDPETPTVFGASAVEAWHVVRGVATSGWRGRSFSLGIADAATVLARDAACADAAATLVGNAVDLPGHGAILRAPASDLDPQSDLGERLVTREVGQLRAFEIEQALDSGAAEAQRLISDGAIVAASLRLQGRTRVVGSLAQHAGATDVVRRPQQSAPRRWEEKEWPRLFARS